MIYSCKRNLALFASAHLFFPDFFCKKVDMKDYKIDLVYLWVNGKDPAWQEKFNNVWDFRLTNKNRYRDNSELRYSLRSVEQNMPWVNKIFIITDEQIPAWLKETPKIRVVDHKEIIEPEFLPCFNSEAIELRMSRIKELAERFILASDDFFVYKPLAKSFFFDDDGEPVYRFIRRPGLDANRPHNLYYENLIFTKNLVENSGYKLPPDLEPYHNFDPYKKSFIEEVQKEFQPAIKNTLQKKVRGSGSFQRVAYSLLDISKNERKWKIDTEEDNIYFSVGDVNKIFQTLTEKKPFLFCINDDERSGEWFIRLPLLLESLFPNKATWEKPVELSIRPCFRGEKHICVVFAPDENYSKYFSATLASLIENSDPKLKYDIVVLEIDIGDYTKRLLNYGLPENFSLRFINVFEYLSTNFNIREFNVRSYWSISTYFKCLIPLLFSSYERVLFCDADLVFVDDFQDFYNVDFDGKLIAGVLDTVSPNLENNLFRKNELLELGIKHPDRTYINAGVILFNTKEIDERKYREELNSGIKLPLPFQDQDLLNLIFQDEVKLSSFKFNFQNGVTIYNPEYLTQIPQKYAELYLEAYNNPVIIHYTGSIKPWHDPHQKLSFYFWMFAKKGPFYELIYSEFLAGKFKQNPSGLKNFLREKSRFLFPLQSKRREYIKKMLVKLGVI